jgi:hypothetical protein
MGERTMIGRQSWARGALTALMAAGVATPGLACMARSGDPGTPPVPQVWTAAACAKCDNAGVEVHLRRSADAGGAPGSYLFARLRNLNPHPVALTVEFVPNAFPVTSDVFLRSESRRLTLHPSSGDSTGTVLMLDSEDIREVVLHAVERY